MIPERADDSHSAADTHSHHRHRSHRHRRHGRSFYRVWIRPYRRQLMSFFLLCAVVITTYMLWKAVAAQ